MKIIFITTYLCFLTSLVFSQDITGKWFGVLKVNKIELRIDMNIIKNEIGYSSTMDSPDQGKNGIIVDSISFVDSLLTFKIIKGKIEYKGKYSKNHLITGIFAQGGLSIPLEFGRIEFGLEKKMKPQDPIKPYPYYSEEVKFKNKKDGITLAGTLTLPSKDGNFPIVILISGSGAQNRDEEILGHKPFLVLSDYLTKNGIGVLRFDDRGSFESEGDFKNSTTNDFSTDVEAAVLYLSKRREVNKKKIGLIGHSEGGLIAPIVASKSKNVSFIVLLAGSAIPGGDLLLLQQERIGRSQGVSEENLLMIKNMNKGAYSVMAANKDTSLLKKELTDYYQPILQDKEMVDLYVAQLTNPWMFNFINYDPRLILAKIKCPVLALNGEKDLQVPSKVNLESIRSILEKNGNSDFTIKEFPSLNHLFQECETGAVDEYAKIEQTISPIVLETISKWIKSK